CFGATTVAALFLTTAVSVVLGGREWPAHGRFINEIAFGGAFGVAGLVLLTVALATSGAPLYAAALAIALLVASFVTMRALLADPAPPALGAPEAARQMAALAAANVNVVRFPYYRTDGAA